MQTYLNKRKGQDRAVPPVQEAAPSRSEMLHLSGTGASAQEKEQKSLCQIVWVTGNGLTGIVKKRGT